MAKKSARRSASQDPKDIPGQAARLVLLRTTLGYTTNVSFAKFLGFQVSRFNAFENGSPLTREVAFRIVQLVPGMTLDWLYFGKPDGLPLELARRLGVFEPPGNRKTP